MSPPGFSTRTPRTWAPNEIAPPSSASHPAFRIACIGAGEDPSRLVLYCAPLCGIIFLPMEQSPDQQAPPRVSAILVSLNNAAALRRSLAPLQASAALQTLAMSVVDIGSTDDCSRMDDEFPGIHMQ